MASFRVSMNAPRRPATTTAPDRPGQPPRGNEPTTTPARPACRPIGRTLPAMSAGQMLSLHDRRGSQRAIPIRRRPPPAWSGQSPAAGSAQQRGRRHPQHPAGALVAGWVQERAEVAVRHPAGLQNLAVGVGAELCHWPAPAAGWVGAPGYPGQAPCWERRPGSGCRPQSHRRGGGGRLDVGSDSTRPLPSAEPSRGAGTTATR
jgi:hypothetical protein